MSDKIKVMLHCEEPECNDPYNERDLFYLGQRDDGKKIYIHTRHLVDNFDLAILQKHIEEKEKLNHAHKKSLKVIPHHKYLKDLAKKGSVLVCSNISRFEDDKKGICSDCGTVIYYRPYNEVANRKLCIDCEMK